MSGNAVKLGATFWIVATILFLWGLLGVTMFMAEVLMGDEAYLENFGEEMLAVRHIVPLWSMAGYGIGVWFGMAGTLALILRKSWAVPLYIISFFGAILGWSWYFFNAQGRSVMEPSSWGMVALVMTLCVFSIWWAKRQKMQGVLR